MRVFTARVAEEILGEGQATYTRTDPYQAACEAEAELNAGQTIGQVCQKLPGVSEQTFHRWRNQYGGCSVTGHGHGHDDATTNGN